MPSEADDGVGGRCSGRKIWLFLEMTVAGFTELPVILAKNKEKMSKWFLRATVVTAVSIVK